ncbi:MAG: bestrophin family protein [Burkholderiales bacterium]|nr:bestrophin [Burkholderiales bacterium]MDE1926683.1 bestrophin family protein [Burkholderiales bacterium]MDE2158851.1 bestrophin family protein [Burkholderiales bacterium]MDE2502404.1 bestrophin family protein [Burkholderiales bacterium]
MVVTGRPNAWRLFFAMRGSVLPHIATSILACTALATLVTLTHGLLFSWKVTLTPVPFTLIGLALAIFLGFRNGAAYDRFWEARKLWGELIHRSRTLARQQAWVAGAAPGGEGDRLVRRAIAYAHALRCQLRGLDARADTARWLAADEQAGLEASRGGGQYLLRRHTEDLARWVREGRLAAPLAAEMDRTLSALGAVQAGCERIASTPIPFAYTLLLHRTAYLYCLLLPFGLVDLIGIMTPVVVAIVSYTFFGLDAHGDEIEQPFGLRPHHLPLDALCRTIEINLLEAAGARDLPAPLDPVDHLLH